MTSQKDESSLQIWKKDIRIHYNDVLGKGGYGQVFSGSYDRKKVAIKLLINKGKIDKRTEKELRREAERLIELSEHSAVIALYGILLEEDHYGLVIEYMHFGNSFDFVRDYEVKSPLLLRMISQVASAMKHLHSFTPPMFHGDLKADNILINNFFNAKVCDFGLSEWKTTSQMMTPDQPANARGGTLCHTAPERLKDLNCKSTKAMDIYSFGITVWELFAGERPYKNVVDLTLIKTSVCEGQRPDLESLCSDCPEIIRLMISKCWHQDGLKRPEFDVIFEEMDKAYMEHKHEINSIIKSIRSQICEKCDKNDPEYIDTMYIDNQLETDQLSLIDRPEELSVMLPLKPIEEQLSEFDDRTTATKNAGPASGSICTPQIQDTVIEDPSWERLQRLNIEDDSSAKTSDGTNTGPKASETIEETANKIGTVDHQDNQNIGDTPQQRNEDMIDAVAEQNTDNSQSREMEMEQKNNNDQDIVRPKETKMPGSFPEPSVVNLKNSNDAFQGVDPFLDIGPKREIMPEQPYSSVEVDELSKKGTFGPEPPKRSRADPLQPRAEIPDSNMQPQAGPQPNIHKRSNTSEMPPSKSESTSRHPPKDRNQTSEGGTPPPNQTPPMGGATRFGEPIGQPGRMTISHQHSGGGFTHIDMDQNSKVQPNVQVGDRNVMVVGGSRNSDSDDERRGAKTSTKRKSKKKSNRHLKLPDKPVENDDIDVVCVDIGRDWKRLCRGLGLDDPRIEQIYQDYHVSGQYEVIYQSLRVWRNKTGQAATVRALGQHLSNIDRDDLIKKLNELYRD